MQTLGTSMKTKLGNGASTALNATRDVASTYSPDLLSELSREAITTLVETLDTTSRKTLTKALTNIERLAERVSNLGPLPSKPSETHSCKCAPRSEP